VANTLTNLINTIYAALNVVSRERVGFIPAVSRNSSLERAALNQNILVPIVPASSTADNTPGVTAPDTGDQVIGNAEVKITKSKHVPIRWNGEETRGMQNSGIFGTTLQNQFEEAFRVLCNEIEADLAQSYKYASRAYGTAGTAPFGTANDLTDVAGVRQILDDNGCPQSDLHLVISNGAMANVRGKQSQLFKVNEAGSNELLRQGTIGELEGFMMGQSGQVAAHTKGTGASYLSDQSTQAIGSTALHMDTGTGTVLAGDVITAAGDANKYVVNTGHAGDGDQDYVLNKPGLRVALANDVALTVGNSYRANLAFHRSAIQLVTRMPALPEGGDAADDLIQVTDPVSGLSFEIAVYRQYLQKVYHVRLAWGYKPVKQEHIAILLG
jgi:hypothetical protein